MSATMPVQRLDRGKSGDGRHKMRNPALGLKRAQKRILRLKRELGSWRAVGREVGLSAGTLIRISQGYEPRSSHIRHALGLPIYVTLQVCAKCGKVHRQHKQCTSKPRTYQRIADMPVAVLAWKIRNREEIDVGPSGL